MGGGRLEAAKGALDRLIARLDKRDRLGVVAFDDTADVAVPAGPLSDKHAVRQRTAQIQPGGTTNLSSGYLRGIQEAQRAAGDGRATLLLLSDGHANEGVTDHDARGAASRVLEALGEIVGESADTLRRAGEALEPRDGQAAEGAAFARLASPGPQAQEAPAPASPGTTGPAAEDEWDELDALFRGG